jgi:hypothetical protein
MFKTVAEARDLSSLCTWVLVLGEPKYWATTSGCHGELLADQSRRGDLPSSLKSLVSLIHTLPPSLNVSIFRVQNFAHNIIIPMDKDKNKGVGGWVESWWIV